MTISELLLPEFDAEVATTRRVLEQVPDGAEEADWKPHPKGFSMAHLAQLVVMIPGWLPYMVDRNELDIAPKDGPKTGSMYRNQKTAALLEQFDAVVKAGREAIARASDAHWQTEWTLKAGGNEVQKGTRYFMTRTTVLNHLVHHRGQLTTYLRATDHKVPEVYGPTPDTKRG